MHRTIAAVPQQIINTIVEPSSSYFTPLKHTHSDTDLDIGLESLYSLESLGIDEDADQGCIDSFLFEGSLMVLSLGTASIL